MDDQGQQVPGGSTPTPASDQGGQPAWTPPVDGGTVPTPSPSEPTVPPVPAGDGGQGGQAPSGAPMA